ncbi:hypothetical protein EDB80DRAFT_705185 [Ilyonectria destructans]|nr:hypothetical protein EDB80DRAFT_705185 [Ilyonectria destructans]
MKHTTVTERLIIIAPCWCSLQTTMAVSTLLTRLSQSGSVGVLSVPCTPRQAPLCFSLSDLNLGRPLSCAAGTIGSSRHTAIKTAIALHTHGFGAGSDGEECSSHSPIAVPRNQSEDN